MANFNIDDALYFAVTPSIKPALCAYENQLGSNKNRVSETLMDITIVPIKNNCFNHFLSWNIKPGLENLIISLNKNGNDKNNEIKKIESHLNETHSVGEYTDVQSWHGLNTEKYSFNKPSIKYHDINIDITKTASILLSLILSSSRCDCNGASLSDGRVKDMLTIDPVHIS
tara:strand:- start:4220 stop:4732 length:513 start_codon:yes stop_codon:yes gene_type:complete